MSKNAEYIPGDLVMTNGVPLGTEEGVVYRVVSSDPSKTVTFSNGTVLKGCVTLENATELSKGDKGYLFCDSPAWFKDLVPIPISRQILEANGWKRNGSRYLYKDLTIGDSPLFYATFVKMSSLSDKNKKFYMLHISLSKYLGLSCYYVHKFQHFLLGMSIDSDLKLNDIAKDTKQNE